MKPIGGYKMPNITKKDLVETISQDKEISSYGISKKEIASVIDVWLEKLKDQICEFAIGDRIELRNFGTFLVKERKGRSARNPKTGEPVKVGPRKHCAFKPGREMKEKVR